MAKMTCPVCGQKFDEQHVQFLNNGNPACPACVEAENAKEKTQNNNAKGDEPQKKTCKKCKAEFDASQDFCPNCGRKYIPFIPFLCSNCQHEIENETKFCPSCGKKAISLLEKEKRKKRLKKAGIISLAVLGLLLVGFIIFLNIRSKQDIAEVEKLIDEIGHDYSSLHNKEDSQNLKGKIAVASYHYEHLSKSEKAKVNNYSHLEEASIEYQARYIAEERLRKLRDVVLYDAEWEVRRSLKNSSSFKLMHKYIDEDKIYEYNGNCYVRAIVAFSAANSYGGTVDDSKTVYYIFKGKYTDISTTTDIDLSVTDYAVYNMASENGKLIDPFEW